METKIFFWKYKGPIERVKTKILRKLIIRKSENKKSHLEFFFTKSQKERMDRVLSHLDGIHTFTKY